MSMISAQIDELRERAKELRNLAPDPDVPHLVPSTKETMALAMRSAASEMDDAADTIWQLRDDLQRANDAARDAEHDESRAWDRVRKAEAEADRLRELVREMWPHVRHRSRMCAECELPCGKSHECLLYEPMRERMRELGIEVDG